jgi:hypothetical protein
VCEKDSSTTQQDIRESEMIQTCEHLNAMQIVKLGSLGSRDTEGVIE